MNEVRSFTENMLTNTFCLYTHTFPQNYAEMPDNCMEMQNEKFN